MNGKSSNNLLTSEICCSVAEIKNFSSSKDFIISKESVEDKSSLGERHVNVFKEEVFNDAHSHNRRCSPMYASDNEVEKSKDEFDLSDISSTPKEQTKDDDIHAA